MKRTCETCAFLNEGECIRHFLAPKSAMPFDPACKDYTLSFSEFKWALAESRDKARKKHPGFVPLPTLDWEEGFVKDARWHAGAVPCLRNVLLAEVFEFLAEVARGDFDRALEEAGDVMAIMYRALNGDGQKKEDSND